MLVALVCILIVLILQVLALVTGLALMKKHSAVFAKFRVCDILQLRIDASIYMLTVGTTSLSLVKSAAQVCQLLDGTWAVVVMIEGQWYCVQCLLQLITAFLVLMFHVVIFRMFANSTVRRILEMEVANVEA